MKKLVLVRHGESIWNRENRFTGWTDVDLTPQGVEEARAAGRLLAAEGYDFDLAFTSVLKRAIRTLNLALEQMDRLWLPVEKDWRLNERHYGALQGLNKSETAAKFGEEQVLVWRRSYDTPPPELAAGDRVLVVAHGNSLRAMVKFLDGISDADIVGLNIPTAVPLVYELDDERHPAHDPRYAGVANPPATESLATTLERVVPCWNETIAPDLRAGKDVLIAAHGNSLRALVKMLDKVSDEEITGFNIPTGIPLVYDLDGDLNPLSREFLGDPEEVARAAAAVAAQGKAK